MGKIIKKRNYESIVKDFSQIKSSEEFETSMKQFRILLKREKSSSPIPKNLKTKLMNKKRSTSLHNPNLHKNDISNIINMKKRNILSNLYNPPAEESKNIGNMNSMNDNSFTKMRNTQEKYFKLQEKNFLNSNKIESRVQSSKETISKTKFQRLENSQSKSPNRYYDLSKSLSCTRLRDPQCIIFKENKFNGHSGIYKTIKKYKEVEPINFPNLNDKINESFGKREENNIIKDLKVFINKKQMRARIQNTIEEMFKFSLKPLKNNFEIEANEKFKEVKEMAKNFHLKYIRRNNPFG